MDEFDSDSDSLPSESDLPLHFPNPLNSASDLLSHLPHPLDQLEEFNDMDEKDPASGSTNDEDYSGMPSLTSSSDDSSSSESESNPESHSMHRPARGRPCAPQGSTADTRRNAQRRRRAREKKREDKLEHDWRCAVASRDDTLADELYSALLPTVRGRHLFPSQTKTESELRSMRGLGDNVKQLNAQLGQRSKHRQHLLTRITKGLPPSFCKETLNVKASYLRKARQREDEDDTPPALLEEGRKEGDGRHAWGETYEAEVKRFFESRTEIMSGADTHTRRLLMTKGRLEIEFEAQYPAMLRKITELEPDLIKLTSENRLLTQKQKDMLAAVFAADQPQFSAAEEYRTRLEAALERYICMY